MNSVNASDRTLYVTSGSGSFISQNDGVSPNNANPTSHIKFSGEWSTTEILAAFLRFLRLAAARHFPDSAHGKVFIARGRRGDSSHVQ